MAGAPGDEPEDERIRAIARDEVVRMRVREADAGSAFRSWVSRVLESPLTRVLIGFVLTGVVAQWISWNYAEKREADALRRASLEAARGFSADARRQLRLLSGLRAAVAFDHAPLEVRQLRQDYERDYIDWSASVHANRLLFREFFGYTRRHYLEATLDEALLPLLHAIRVCVLNSARLQEKGDRQGAVGALTTCGFPPYVADAEQVPMQFLLDRTSDCENEISSLITEYIMTGQHCGIDSWRQQGEQIYRGVIRICGPTDDHVAEEQARSGEIWPYSNAADDRYRQNCARDELDGMIPFVGQ